MKNSSEFDSYNHELRIWFSDVLVLYIFYKYTYGYNCPSLLRKFNKIHKPNSTKTPQPHLVRQRRKDRFVRPGRGPSDLRNRREEKGILEAHWGRHGGLSANWWYCNNCREKRSEYREMKRPFPWRRLNKKSLPDPFPWGSEAMAIKTSLLIPLV